MDYHVRSFLLDEFHIQHSLRYSHRFSKILFNQILKMCGSKRITKYQYLWQFLVFSMSNKCCAPIKKRWISVG